MPFLRATRLSDHGGGGGGLVLPGGGKNADGLVVAGETVDAGLDENEAELGVLVLAVALEVLANGNGLHIMVSIFGPRWSAIPGPANAPS